MLAIKSTQVLHRGNGASVAADVQGEVRKLHSEARGQNRRPGLAERKKGNESQFMLDLYTEKQDHR